MFSTLDDHCEWLIKSNNLSLLTQLQHGIEKEGLRVNAAGRISQSPHPIALGSALSNSTITTDYSEALLEFVTPVFPSSQQALQFLADLHGFAYQNLGDEIIWPASMPCAFSNENDIAIANYGSSNIGRLKHIYRIGLEHRYGRMMQAVAGIHYNFSLPNKFWPLYGQYCHSAKQPQQLRSEAYFTLIGNFRRYSWLLLYLFGASPAVDASFINKRSHCLDNWDKDTFYLPYATSIRMSNLGYSNLMQKSLNICFNNLDEYTQTLAQAIRQPHKEYQKIGVKVDGAYRQLNANILQIENEYYADIRPKCVARSGEKPICALIGRGIEYIEVRNTDINPLLALGIDQQQSDFFDAFLLSCLLGEKTTTRTKECAEINKNHQRVVFHGRQPGLQLWHQGQEIDRSLLGEQILRMVDRGAALLDLAHGDKRVSAAVAGQRAKLADGELCPSAQVLQKMHDQRLSHVQFVLEQGRQQQADATISSEQASLLQQQAEHSLQQQLAIEQTDSIDFDTFLQRYLNECLL